MSPSPTLNRDLAALLTDGLAGAADPAARARENLAALRDALDALDSLDALSAPEPASEDSGSFLLLGYPTEPATDFWALHTAALTGKRAA